MPENNTISHNNITNNGDGIYLVWSSGNTISNNRIINNNGHGLGICYSPGVVLRGNVVENCSYGFSVEGNNLEDFILDVDTSNTIDGKPIYYLLGRVNELYDGVAMGYLALVNCENVTVMNVELSGNVQGILIVNTTNSKIQNSNITNNSENGIRLYESSNNTITGNNINNNGIDNLVGINLEYSSGNVISGNNINNNGNGIRLYESSNNTISGNNMTNNGGSGIYLHYSSNNTISGNNMTNNFYGIGFLYSSGNTISGNNMNSNSWNGIILFMSSNNNMILWNNMTNNYNGIELYESSDNTISGNNINDNGWAGICIDWSSGNMVSGNNIMRNEYGVSLFESVDNQVVGNVFFRNVQQAYVEGGSGNIFNGNGWSDYTGFDNDGDGFGDTPYYFIVGFDPSPRILPLPDLVVTSLNDPGSVTVQQEFEVSWTVKNQGSIDAVGEWEDRLYLSIDNKLDENDILLASGQYSGNLPPSGSYTTTQNVTIPQINPGNYYLLVYTDSQNNLSESKEWNNIYHKMITIVEEGQQTGFSRETSRETNLVEDILTQKGNLNNGTVTGDLSGNFKFTKFEIVKIDSGTFTGEGFAKGEWEATLDGITYQGEWQGVYIFKPSENRAYLKGAITGSEARGTFEAYLTESTPGTYDQYTATWTLGYLCNETTTIKLNLNGKLNYQELVRYPTVKIYALQTVADGKTLGHYNEPISAVLTQIRIEDEQNPYNKQGFSIISYTSKIGQGEAYTYDKITGTTLNMIGTSTKPLEGITTGTLTNTTILLNIERTDLGLPPTPNLKVEVWGPERVSPGQKINYIIEYRNDGLATAENVTITYRLPSQVKYLLSTVDGRYNGVYHDVTWHIKNIPPKTVGYLAVIGEVAWGLSQGSSLENTISITQGTGLLFDGEKLLEVFPGTSIEIVQADQDYLKLLIEIPEIGDNASFVLESRFEYAQNESDPILEYNMVDGKLVINGSVAKPGSPIIAVFLVAYSTYKVASTFMDIIEVIAECKRIYDNYKARQEILDNARNKGWINPVEYDLLDSKNNLNTLGDFFTKLVSGILDIIDSKIPEALKGKILITKGIELIKKYISEIPDKNHEKWLEELIKALGPDSRNYLQEEYKNKGIVNDMDSHTSTVTVAHDPNIKYGLEGDVLPGQELNYTIEYENEGEGIAFGVYFTDTLDEDLDETTLTIGPVISTTNNTIIAPPGTYNPTTRTITWLVGEVGPKEGGYANITIKIRENATNGTEIINYATVHFPSVPETTKTNAIISIVKTLEIIEIDPANNTHTTPLNKTITVTFNNNIQPGPNYNNITVKFNGVDKAITKTINQNKLLINTDTWNPGTTFTIMIPKDALKNSAGSMLETDFKSTFTAAIKIKSIDPAKGALTVPLNKTITVTFSNNILKGPGYNKITVKTSTGTTKTITKTITGNKLYIKATGGWNPGMKFIITIPKNAVKNSLGSMLATDFKSSFTAAR